MLRISTLLFVRMSEEESGTKSTGGSLSSPDGPGIRTVVDILVESSTPSRFRHWKFLGGTLSG